MTMETPIPTTTAPAPPSADQLSAMSELTTRMAGLSNNQYEERTRLMEAVHAEIGRGGTGWDALNGNPAKLAAEAEVRTMAEQSGNAAAVGTTPAADYSALRPEAFGDHDERQAFGETMSSAGLDVRVVQSLVADVAGDRYVTEAIRQGEAGIDARLHEVRAFFERNGQMDDLRLAVAFGEHLVAKQPKLSATWDAAMLSENALFSLAAEARRLGFTA
ncbi:hypothetical protein J2X48_000915 [Bosea sp. BE271]|uniref:hypothetical protein n=1 Tax=Bosea TaxID=85413 RepID=UPI002854DFFB|nr:MULTISPECIES: hypothetical protein [Bosea]MDR6827197.1 hypothetical protein [Bosea robiniae]MDR6893907.1 hypothetical protein [Bosea sp. BE109]MDR7137302.1 hypothetical protein [Bosea sp. BE168]MDR7174002.1 hypothetical protein [Bosea sp. BE271]